VCAPAPFSVLLFLGHCGPLFDSGWTVRGAERVGGDNTAKGPRPGLEPGPTAWMKYSLYTWNTRSTS